MQLWIVPEQHEVRVPEQDVRSEGAGQKFDSGKLRHSLMPSGVVNLILSVLEFGAKKYAPDNWKIVPCAKERYYNAAMRHIEAWWTGETNDTETTLPHLAHALCCLAFLLWLDENKDRTSEEATL